MGREIRRVPSGWEHPRKENGLYQPMYDEDYDTAAEEWLKNCINFSDGSHSDLTEYDPKEKYWWDWEGPPPNKEYYHPKFENPECFQIYENVSEGTPVSPVFKTKSEMGSWLISEGYPPESAKAFCENEWAPSFVISPEMGLKTA